MLRVVPATGKRLRPALELLFGALPLKARSQRIIEVEEEIAREEFDPQDLVVAEIDAVPIGAQLTVIRDGVGMVWPPVVSTQAVQQLKRFSCEEIEDALLREARERLDAASAWIGQVLLDRDQWREQAAMERNGFPRLTDLHFFERSLADMTALQPSQRRDLTYEPYRRSHNRLAFINALQATYAGTLDCPELGAARDARQSLKYHETAGVFTSDMWRLYRREGAAVGIQLLVERREQKAWEVIYLGVIKPARREGIGRAMLADAMEAASAAKAERLLIVADARNLPAIKLYQSLGFEIVATRVAFARLMKSTK